MPRLAVLHTAASLVEMFKSLLARAYPALDSFQVLDESLLQDLIRHGPSEAIERRVAMHAILARDAGASLMLFTCSSTSPAIDVARRLVDIPILKIDDPMAERAIELQTRIGIVCTTTSTKGPSQALIRTTRQQRANRLRSRRRCHGVGSLLGVCHVPCGVAVPQVWSGCYDRGPPRVHRRGAKCAVRLGRCEMALDVKGVIDGCMG